MVAKVWFTAQLYRPMIAFRSSGIAARSLYPLADFAFAIPTIMLAARETRDQDAAAWPEGRGLDRARLESDVAQLHPRLPVCHGARKGLLGYRRRRQPLPRFHRRDRSRSE